jgi:hypothetical protein
MTMKKPGKSESEPLPEGIVLGEDGRATAQ